MYKYSLFGGKTAFLNSRVLHVSASVQRASAQKVVFLCLYDNETNVVFS